MKIVMSLRLALFKQQGRFSKNPNNKPSIQIGLWQWGDHTSQLLAHDETCSTERLACLYFLSESHRPHHPQCLLLFPSPTVILTCGLRHVHIFVIQYHVVGGILTFYIQYIAMYLIKFPTFFLLSQHCEEVLAAIRWACVCLPMPGEFIKCTLTATLKWQFAPVQNSLERKQ